MPAGSPRVPSWWPRFRGALHDPRTATVLGRWLGAAVLVCFGTGLVSHVLQEPPGWAAPRLPSRPVWGYRLTQGLHVATGIAAVPLLLAKLWTVYPRLFARPVVRSPLHALERLSAGLLVGAALLEVFLGLLNTAQWYVWPFSFRRVHWALAWVLAGALLLHLAVRAPVIAAHWRHRSAGTRALPAADAPDRRSLLLGVGTAAAAVTAVTAGQTFPPLRPLLLLAPRHPGRGPQGLPVNRTAAAAGIGREALRDWRLVVDGPRPYALTLEGLAELEQHEARLPIACVEGWSASARWGGVRVRDLLRRAGAPDGSRVRVVSLQRRGAFAVTELGPSYARDPLTLLALRIDGEVLHPDHGYPARLIAPNRPGVLQTKWVTRLEVL
ncbi:molybdopterin-dependent oxidoreductase [Streptomyces sp. TRM 70361]|uniref:molybdopterin-dependent oxidoreductase n=1 Tax=Streptomyces sp. TRM 70361 TaxID=3116553 RepID=UPI002E7C1682|nr:molybdopterin-dependent oxidoreductase [Streptomyces sp. TRM 70361]MEE1940687.1 molybdopterin-dependent oxidoreductase [Streptomyces sp. TRM 70361]